MDAAIVYLTSIGIVLLFGIICTIIASKMKIPNVLLLLILGIGLSQISYNGEKIISFPPTFLTAISILALVMIIFDSCSRFKLKEFDDLSIKTLKMVGVNLTLNLIILTFFMYQIFKIKNLFIAAVFAAMMSGTAAETVLTIFQGNKSRVLEFLEIESILNTPLMVLIPFMIIDLMSSVGTQMAVSKFIEQIAPFIQQIITGIGAGVLVGIIVFKFMRKHYSENLSPVAMITAALLAYVMAERLGGNGVLAVTTLGLFFGNIYIKEKWKLHQFSGMLANSLEILVFVLVGLVIILPQSYVFFVRSLVLFLVFLLVRYLSVLIVTRKEEFTIKEKVFITLNAPKGIALATIAFTLTTFDIAGISTILEVTLAFLLYSILLSTVTVRFSKYFLGAKK